jgi:hypothetical protein
MRQQVRVQQQQVQRPAGTFVKTKKHGLDKKLYIRIAMEAALKEFWYAWFVPLVIMLIPIFVSNSFWWCFGIALTLSILFVLFWGIQFGGITQIEQGKILFEKFSYEIDAKNIIAKRSEKEGMVLTWEQIKKVEYKKDAFLLWLSRGQFIHLPFTLFKEQELRLMENILRRNNFPKPKPKNAAKTETANAETKIDTKTEKK